jgi:hypothetical protein
VDDASGASYAPVVVSRAFAEPTVLREAPAPTDTRVAFSQPLLMSMRHSAAMRFTGIVLMLLGLLFGLDVVNVGSSFIDEGPLAWVLAGVGLLLFVGSMMTRPVRR